MGARVSDSVAPSYISSWKTASCSSYTVGDGIHFELGFAFGFGEAAAFLVSCGLFRLRSECPDFEGGGVPVSMDETEELESLSESVSQFSVAFEAAFSGTCLGPVRDPAGDSVVIAPSSGAGHSRSVKDSAGGGAGASLAFGFLGLGALRLVQVFTV